MYGKKKNETNFYTQIQNADLAIFKSFGKNDNGLTNCSQIIQIHVPVLKKYFWFIVL